MPALQVRQTIRPQRPSAIRTRIKTSWWPLTITILGLRDHLPLEQGLRRARNRLCRVGCHHLRDHLPLEQGLRLADKAREVVVSLLRDHLPLEQGLSPVDYSAVYHLFFSHRPSAKEQGLRQARPLIYH